MRWRMHSILLRVAAMVLAALHVGLLWQRIEDLSITEPEVIARWVAAAIAAAAALLLIHLRVSWRSWLAFWVVVVLLHIAMPALDVPVGVVTETVVAIGPLLLWIVGSAFACLRIHALQIDRARITLPFALLTASLTSRAPPSL